MSARSHTWWPRLAATLALLIGGWLVLHAQRGPERPTADPGDRNRARPAAREKLQSVSAAAIDRGLQEDPEAPLPRDASSVRVRRAGGAFEPGKVIVRLRDGGTAAARAAVMRAARGRSITRPSYANFDVITVDPARNPEEIAAALRARPDVEYAQAAYRVHAYFRPNDPLYARQWNMALIGLEQGWDINNGGSSSVTVAVLDSGVAYQNAIYRFNAGPFFDGVTVYPGLGSIQVPFAAAPELGDGTRFVAPRDFIWNDTDPVDMDGHGTHVAGTIASLTNNGDGVAGVAFNVKLMPVKCIAGPWDDIFGSPNFGSDDDIARAIRYAADNGAQVINMSIGRSVGPEAPAIADAIRYAVSRGAFVAVAGGNDFEDGNPPERLAEAAAPIDGAIVVGAIGPDRNRAFYSGVNSYIEIAAPGGSTRLSDGLVLQQTFDAGLSETYLLPPSRYVAPRFDVFAYRGFQGTSMATPHVSGLAALLISQGVTKPEAVEAAIKRFAADRGPDGRDDEYGFGIIDARTTLRGLGILR